MTRYLVLLSTKHYIRLKDEATGVKVGRPAGHPIKRRAWVTSAGWHPLAIREGKEIPDGEANCSYFALCAYLGLTIKEAVEGIA